MSWLLDQSTTVLVVLSLLLVVVVAVGSRWLIRRVVPADDLPGVSAVAGPLMPALGALFALLCALALSTEAGVLRSAGEDASVEGAAAARLAWATTSPGVPERELQGALDDYLAATRAREWADGSPDGDPTAMRRLERLEADVRDAAAAKTLTSAESSELLTSLDALSVARRQRLASLGSTLPELYLVVVVASGLALVANSAGLAIGHPRRTASLTAGLVVVVGLTVGLLLAVSAPFEGGFTVSGRPIDLVREGVQSGSFHR